MRDAQEHRTTDRIGQARVVVELQGGVLVGVGWCAVEHIVQAYAEAQVRHAGIDHRGIDQRVTADPARTILVAVARLQALRQCQLPAATLPGVLRQVLPAQHRHVAGKAAHAGDVGPAGFGLVVVARDPTGFEGEAELAPGCRARGPAERQAEALRLQAPQVLDRRVDVGDQVGAGGVQAVAVPLALGRCQLAATHDAPGVAQRVVEHGVV